MTNDLSTYEQDLLAWRQAAEDTLRADDGWLTVVGLDWLHEGENRVGAGADCDVRLAEGSAPAEVGTIVYDGERAVLHPADSAGVRVNGELAGVRELASDATGKPDMVTVGSVTFFLIRRGERLGVRIRDTQSPARRGFGGRVWYPVRPELRVEAVYAPYDPPRPLAITNILGDTEEYQAAGLVSFSVGGAAVQLEAIGRMDGGLWFIFRDATSGHGTYPAARFLYADAPRDGVVVVDFNRAVSPPCAFTDFATCPLPPRQNILSVAIEAGERYEQAAH